MTNHTKPLTTSSAMPVKLAQKHGWIAIRRNSPIMIALCGKFVSEMKRPPVLVFRRTQCNESKRWKWSEELKSLQSISGKDFPNFEMLDAKIASAPNMISQNSNSRRRSISRNRGRYLVKNTFIQKHFHPKMGSSNDIFIPNHFHPTLNTKP